MRRASEATRGCYNPPTPDGKTGSGVICGYVRRAGRGHDEACTRRLVEYGAREVVVGTSRDDLETLVSGLRRGDVLAVPSLDHLAVSMWRVFDMLDGLDPRGVAFVSLAEAVDTRVPKVAEALDLMRRVLDAERRLVSRRSAEARSGSPPPTPANDPLLERSRRVAAPWIEDVRAFRPRLTWEELVDRVGRSGRGAEALSASLMRRHVRRLVAAGDLPGTVLERSQRTQEEASARAAQRAREMVAADAGLSLREIAAALEAEGIMPPRADSWSAQTVKRLLGD